MRLGLDGVNALERYQPLVDRAFPEPQHVASKPDAARNLAAAPAAQHRLGAEAQVFG
jgi:hypothetical protein